MAYNIIVTLKDAKDIKKVSNLIAELVENATGQRAVLHVHDRNKSMKKSEAEKIGIQEKLLK